jgi:hypothetical protein
MFQRKVLLLNASNMDSFPVYPYAFIQVTAVARRANIEVICQDLLGIAQEAWPQIIRGLQQRHKPAMVLITLRNTDSMVYQDYRVDGSGKGSGYFPIAQTKALIDIIRAVTDVPVAVGGFGFTLLAQELMPILRPDFGVFGSADEFFLHFEDILQWDYRHVANLLYFQGDTVVANKRIYSPPSPHVEYTPQVIEEMSAFYEKFPKPGFQGAPVEIMRGCSHACVFCSEPFVVGHKVQYRDLAAIMGDIQLLVKNGVTEIYMVMSELNPEGNAFILHLADTIREFNEQQPVERKVSWFGANYLLKFDCEDYRRLYASGFTGGWFDITALDDENARAMRTPYQNETLVGRLQTYAQVHRTGFDQPRRAEADAEAGSTEEKQKVGWSMFLGNPATSMETIRKTLAVANGAGLAALFDSAHIIRPLRVFDYEKPSTETLGVTFSVNHQLQRVPYQQTLPSFAYPPALLNHLGTEEAIETMFAHIGETYLSTGYMETRDWVEFLVEQAPGGIPGSASGWGERPSADQAKKRVDSFLRQFCQTFTKELTAVGLPTSLAELQQMTPYSLAMALYAHYDSAAEVAEAVCAQAHIELNDERRQMVDFFVETILYRFNVQLTLEYKPLFMLDS